MSSKKAENIYRTIGGGLGSITEALEALSSLQDANIKIRKKKKKDPTLDDILKRDGVSKMDSDSFNKWFKKFMKVNKEK